MKGKWREQYYKAEWTKSVDITWLYQMTASTAIIKKRVEELDDKNLLSEVHRLHLALTRAQEIIVDFKLAEYEMPEVEPISKEAALTPNLRLLNPDKKTL